MDAKLLQGLQGKPKSIKLYEPIIKMNRGYVMRFYYGYDSETKKTHKKDVYLDLDYYFTPSNAWERSQNKEAKKQANQILEALNTANREGKYPIAKTNPLSVSERNFIDWLSKATQEDGKYSDNTKKSYKALINHLKKFAGNHIPFETIDKSFVAKFYDHLKYDSVNSKGISTSSNSSIKYHKQFYFHLAKASTLFNFELPNNIKYAQDKTDSKPKEYLTTKELETLISTPEPNFTLRMGFLFGCFTGLPFEEIIHAKFYDVKEDNKGRYYLEYQRKKTSNYNNIPLSSNASKVIDQMKQVNGNSSSQSIFKGLKYSGYNNSLLQNWVNRAGITKKITPHCCRNTFSAIHYDKYKDVGALMQILGHKDISTTQRYLAKFLKNIDLDVDLLPEFDLGI
jgi:integrase